MGRTASLVFLRYDNEDRIGLELAQLLRSEDYLRGSKRLEVGYLTPGAASWSLLRAEPPDLLATPAPGDELPRLADLARRLRCDAFHFELLADESVSILEANADGAHLSSGSDLEQASFSLITVPDNLRYIVEDDDVERVPERMARALGVDQNAVEDETAETITVWYTPSRLPAKQAPAEVPRKPVRAKGRGRSR